MLETYVSFDNLSNFFYFDDFKNIIINIKNYLTMSFIEHNKTYPIHEIINSTFKKLNQLIEELVINIPDIPAIIIVLIKKIIRHWLNNINLHYRIKLKSQILYFSFWDVLFINQSEEEDFTITIYDGNTACDIGLNLQLLHTVIVHILQLIIKIYQNNILEIYLCKLKDNFRLGIVQTGPLITVEQLLIYRHYQDEGLHLFFLNNQFDLLNTEYNKIDSFTSSKKIIQSNIKIMIPWVCKSFEQILIANNFTNLNNNFLSIILNYCEVNNIYDIIEQNYRFYLKDVKQMKEDLITLSNTRLFQSKTNLLVSKRIKSKLRTRKSKL